MIDCPLCYPGECTSASHAVAELAEDEANTCHVCGATPGNPCDPAAHAPAWPAQAELQKCRSCGCTNEDCSRCYAKTGSPCYWVEDDLCSACKPGAPLIPLELDFQVFHYDSAGRLQPNGGK